MARHRSPKLAAARLLSKLLSRVERRIGPAEPLGAADERLVKSPDSRRAVRLMLVKARHVRDEGRIDEAVILSSSALAQQIRFYGADHRVTLDAEVWLGLLLAESKRFVEAEPYLAHVVEASALIPGFDGSGATTWLEHTRNELNRSIEQRRDLLD